MVTEKKDKNKQTRDTVMAHPQIKGKEIKRKEYKEDRKQPKRKKNTGSRIKTKNNTQVEEKGKIVRRKQRVNVK